MRLRLCLIAVLAVANAAVARAEPGPASGYLMATPTSLFSFGMYQLRLTIE
ncbi:MAG: hypothetical protein VW169_12295 [Rhodospirillaceae bacterium]